VGAGKHRIAGHVDQAAAGSGAVVEFGEQVLRPVTPQKAGGRPARVRRATVFQLIGSRVPHAPRTPSMKPAREARSAGTPEDAGG